MIEIIQENIMHSDMAYDVRLRIDFIEQVTEHELSTIDSLLANNLLNLGIGLAAAQGTGFIEASLLDFGTNSNFVTLRECVTTILVPYASIIQKVAYYKSEATQAHFNFIAEKEYRLKSIFHKSKTVFPKVSFTKIKHSTNSPESTYFSGSDTGKIINIFVSELVYEQKQWIRFSISSRRLKNHEVDRLLQKINQIHPNSSRIKWNWFDYNYETEKWEFPKSRKLFEYI